MKKILTLFLGIALKLTILAAEHPKSLVVALGIAPNMAHGQFTSVFRHSDSAEVFPGSWSGDNLYAITDSLGSKGGAFTFYVPNIQWTKFQSAHDDGNPSSFMWLDGSGNFKKSPKSSLTLPSSQITGLLSPVTQTLVGANGLTVTTAANAFTVTMKRSEKYSGTTDASGNYTVSFGTAYSVSPVVIPTIPNQVDKNLLAIVSGVSTTGFTVNVFTRPTITTLPIIGALTGALLGATTSPVTSQSIDVLVSEK